MPKYRIIKVKNVCPWQIQERFLLLFWRNKYLSFSSLKTVEVELDKLINEDGKLNAVKKL